MTITPRHRRGRPALVEGETSTPVNVRVSSKDYDAACIRSTRDRTSVQDVMRRALAKYLAEPQTAK